MLANFQKLRDEWALKMPMPSKEQMDTEAMLDRQKNPHNDNYKPELRSPTQIVSDLSYKFADAVLLRQYGDTYKEWMKRERYEDDPHGRGYSLRRSLGRSVNYANAD